MTEKNENMKDCSKVPYMWPMGCNTYCMPPVSEGMWPMPQNMWGNCPMRCPMCGSYVYMGGFTPWTNTPFPESD